MDEIKTAAYSMKETDLLKGLRLERELVEKKRMIREGENIIRDLEHEM